MNKVSYRGPRTNGLLCWLLKFGEKTCKSDGDVMVGSNVGQPPSTSNASGYRWSFRTASAVRDLLAAQLRELVGELAAQAWVGEDLPVTVAFAALHEPRDERIGSNLVADDKPRLHAI
jgi:hypothetical protein